VIDLDLAVCEKRTTPSGAKGKTGTRAFMAIDVLEGKSHSFMHDLESFFWVLHWICLHYLEPSHGKSRVLREYDQWNYFNSATLAKMKLGEVARESSFIETAKTNYGPYYRPLVPWMNELRRVVFPNGVPCILQDSKLYAKMREILHRARQDPTVLEG
jgi:hypothetical protein